MGFAASLAGNNGEKVFLVTGNEGGKSAWYYVEVARKKMPYYERAIKTGSLDLRDYGNIIDSGWGASPPKSVAKDMEEQYG